MVNVRLNLDGETYQRLLESALAERRPVPWQAEIILRRALGTHSSASSAEPEQHTSLTRDNLHLVGLPETHGAEHQVGEED